MNVTRWRDAQARGVASQLPSDRQNPRELDLDPRAAALRRVQRTQQGLFTLSVALDAGYSRPAIRRRLRSGEWEEVDRRVYQVADGRALHDRGRLFARTLATGGVASELSAAAVWSFVSYPRRS